jgi:hypothetical protein
MTLRTEIHEAIDEVTPPAPRLAWEAEALIDARTQQRHAAGLGPRWARPLRGSLGLVAVALLLVILAGVFVGGRYWRDLHAVPQPVHQQSLTDLEKKPVLFVNLEPGAACPASPIVVYPRGGLAIGGGPVYFIDRNPGSTTRWGSWQQLRFVYWATGPGVVLIRGWDLGSNRAVAFAQDPLGPSRITAAGRVVGTDQIVDKPVQVRTEAYFRDPGASPPKIPALYPLETVMVGEPAGASGCVGLQFDGPNFTENFVISWSHTGL